MSAGSAARTVQLTFPVQEFKIICFDRRQWADRTAIRSGLVEMSDTEDLYKTLGELSLESG